MTPLQIEVSKNIATNGRWFCGGLIAINLVTGSPLLAILALLSIAGAIFSDLVFINDRDAKWLNLSVYIFTALVAIATLVNIW